MDTLMSSAANTAEPNLPPIFHSIAKAGVEEFKRSTKTEHRKGMKRKTLVLSSDSNIKCIKCQGINPLADVTKDHGKRG